jgi:PaaX-like protein
MSRRKSTAITTRQRDIATTKDSLLNMSEIIASWNGGELQTRELVVTFLRAYVIPRDRRVWSGSLVALLGEFGFSIAAARVALVRSQPRSPRKRARGPARILPLQPSNQGAA